MIVGLIDFLFVFAETDSVQINSPLYKGRCPKVPYQNCRWESISIFFGKRPVTSESEHLSVYLNQNKILQILTYNEFPAYQHLSLKNPEYID